MALEPPAGVARERAAAAEFDRRDEGNSRSDQRDEAISATDAMHLATLRRWTGIAKAPAVAELVKNDLESIDKLVVFAVYRQTIKYLEEAIGPSAAVIHGDTPQARRQELIDAFQNTDQPRVLVLQIATAGTALTLHRSHNVVFAETTWTPADVVQAAKRCHRIGQRSSVLVRVVSLAGSIDEIVAAVITRKARELAELEITHRTARGMTYRVAEPTRLRGIRIPRTLPPVYLVVHGTRRVDSFLSRANAAACASA